MDFGERSNILDQPDLGACSWSEAIGVLAAINPVLHRERPRGYGDGKLENLGRL